MHTHSTSPTVRGLAVLAIMLSLSGCSRRVPTAFSADSPASVDAVAAPVADVTLALDGDPPMPGDAAGGWIGLDQPTATTHDHHGHHGHGGHEGHGGEHGEQPEQSESTPEGGHHHGH